MPYTHEAFIAAVRNAASAAQPTKAVRALLEETLRDPEALAREMPEQAEDEVHLYEDETVSIWSCRFRPTEVLPPHEHKMDVHIGVVSGCEKNILFHRTDEGLQHAQTKRVTAGEILSLGPDGVHAVTAGGGAPSHALHVYLGPLTKVSRSLFDWDTGASVPFTDENFERMKRPVGEVDFK